jgi:hypothetical protein
MRFVGVRPLENQAALMRRWRSSRANRRPNFETYRRTVSLGDIQTSFGEVVADIAPISQVISQSVAPAFILERGLPGLPDMPGRPTRSAKSCRQTKTKSHTIEILARKVARRREFKPGIRDDPMIPAAISTLDLSAARAVDAEGEVLDVLVQSKRAGPDVVR